MCCIRNLKEGDDNICSRKVSSKKDPREEQVVMTRVRIMVHLMLYSQFKYLL